MQSNFSDDRILGIEGIREKYDRAYLEEGVLFDSRKNPNQKKFFKEVSEAFFNADKTPYRYFFYGGGIRGGKTAVCMALAHFFCTRVKDLRIHIVRETQSLLSQTTIPSFKRFMPEKMIKKWYRNGSEIFCEFINGSRVYFFAESITGDPDLDRFKGLETNMFILEQIEELSYSTFQKCIERVGSWYVPGKFMPPGIILATFNPTNGWLKKEIYNKWKNNELAPPYKFFQALPQDNPFVTKDQWANWGNMDEISFKRFIGGDWDAGDNENVFLYAFNKEKHVGKNLPFNNYLETWFSFDFNVNPMTCIVAQNNRQLGYVYVLKEFRIENIGIKEFLQIVKDDVTKSWGVEWNKLRIKITGDPAGASRHGMIGNASYYTIIQNDWRVNIRDIVPPEYAPLHEDSRVHCNSFIERYHEFKIDEQCENLINDVMSLKATPEGKIDKTNTGNDTRRKKVYAGHLLDCLRYYIHTLFPRFLDFGR